MPCTKVVLLTGIMETMGSPFSSVNPAGLSWMPAKIVANSTEMKVKNADAVPSFAIMLKVRGSDASQQMMVMAMENSTVRQPRMTLFSVMVLIYSAPTRT